MLAVHIKLSDTYIATISTTTGTLAKMAATS